MKYTVLAVFLLILGFAQMLGDLFSMPLLKGIAAATGASPAPKVFSAHRGLETFSSNFFLQWKEKDGTTQKFAITPKESAKLRGPYNRRNVYGAALSYGPVLTANPITNPMFQAVIHYAFCGEAPLLKELGIKKSENSGPLKIIVAPKNPSKLETALKLVFEVQCNE